MPRLLGFKKNQTQLAVITGPMWLWLCLLLGGASQGGALANLLLQLIAAGIIALWLWNGTRVQSNSTDRFLLYLTGAAVAWICIMFIPLPPGVWQHLPGRDFVVEGYRLLGMKLPWLSMALSPDRALRSALALLPAIAAYFIARRMSVADRRRMIAGVILFAVLSAALGLAQMATGPASPLRLYSPTNRESPVGFFANTNHLAVFLACGLPLAAAWVATINPKKRPQRNHLIALGIYASLLALVMIVGQSLAGLAFLIVALVGSGHILWARSVSGRAKTLILVGAAAAALVLSGSLGAIGAGTIGAKFEDAPNSRGNMTPITLAAGTQVTPVGTGLGSFVQVYAMHQPDRFTSTTWVNHAHNDYAEIYLELGIPGLAFVTIFLFWFLRQGYRIWNRRSQAEALFPQAAWLSISFLLMHSLVDYPLRTAAMAAFFSTMIAILQIEDQDERLGRF